MERHIGKRAEVLLPQDLSVYPLIFRDCSAVSAHLVGMLL